MNAIEQFFLPPQASTHAKNVDDIFMFITYLGIFFFIVVAAAALWFPVRFKRRSANDKTPHFTHNLALEIIWSVIPLALVMVIFFWAFHAYMVGAVPPNDSLEVQAIAKKWSWTFEYPAAGFDIQKSAYFSVTTCVPLRVTLRGLSASP